MTRPMSSSRQSSQPCSQWRSRATRSRAGASAGAWLRGGMAAVVHQAATTMTTASPMSCSAGLMRRAAQAAPIPEPTAAPTGQAACIIGIRVRPAARSTAAPSTLMSTSRVPIPVPAITKPMATSGSEPTMSATPSNVIAVAMSSSAARMARRPPSRCSSGVEPSSPRMDPTVTPARSSPMVPVPMPRSALMAGGRGPQAEMVIPPRPNATVTAHRQRAEDSGTIASTRRNLPVESITLGARRIPGRGRLGRRPRLGAEREQPLEDGQRAADVDRARIEEPLDLQAVRRGDDQRGGIGRVDVRRDAAGLLGSLDPGRQQLAQRAEPPADELPGDGVAFLQGVGAEGRVELDQAGDRPVPFGGLDYLADGGLAHRVRLAGGPELVRPVGLDQEFVARREVVPQRGVGHPDRLADRPQRRPVHPAPREQRDRAVQDLLPAPHAFGVRAAPRPACAGVRHPAIVELTPDPKWGQNRHTKMT